MKSIKHIILALAASLLVFSCEKQQTPESGQTNWPVFLGYMQFSTNVATKAALATDMHEKNFGVMGYRYSSTTNWSAAKALAIPNAFYNLKVNCNSSGICTYDLNAETAEKELKAWAKDSLYSFFAYHPYEGYGNGITLSSESLVNTPMLTFKYPWLGNTTVPIYYTEFKGMYDLMTAEAIDLDGSGNVNLDFKHQLFAVEVLVNNYNENSEGTYDARRKISDMRVTVEGLANSSITVPLSTLNGEKVTTDNIGISDAITFQIQDEQVEIPAFNETITDEDGSVRGRGVATSISKLGTKSKNKGYLMLIPQNDDLNFKVVWTDPDISDFASIKNTLNSTMEFKAGKLYQIIINYVGSGITIAIIEAGSWDINDVYHTFE